MRHASQLRKSFGCHTIDGELMHAHLIGDDPASGIAVVLQDDRDRFYDFEVPAWWAVDWETGETQPDDLVGLRVSIFGEVSADVDLIDSEFPSAGTLYVTKITDVSFIPGRPASAHGRPPDASPFRRT
jgi:hypothetical protein